MSIIKVKSVLVGTIGALSIAACAAETDAAANSGVSEQVVGHEAVVDESVGNEPSAFASCSAGFNQKHEYFGGWSLVSDPLASNVSMELSNKGFMTVDTITDGNSRQLLLTFVDDVGPVVWARRYWTPGLDVLGTSLVETHDEQHVIVTGRIGEDTLIMKIETLTGAVVWSARYFEGDPDTGFTLSKGLLVDRYTDSLGQADYLVAGTARNLELAESHTVLLRIDDNGWLGWGRRYQLASGERRTDIPVALNKHVNENAGIDDAVWLGLNHHIDGSSSFALMDVDGASGAPGFLSYYPQFEEGARVQFGDFVVLPEEYENEFVATYSVTLPEAQGGVPRVAVLPIDPSRTPGPQYLYWNLSPETEFGDQGLAIELAGTNIFDVGTYTFAVGESGEGFVPALLTVDLDGGSPLSYKHYQDYDLSGAGLAPMAPATDGYLLKTFDDPFLHLTRTLPGSTGCCEQDLEPGNEITEVGYEEEEYFTWEWDMDGIDVLSEGMEWKVTVCR